jgi:hypothetical protein
MISIVHAVESRAGTHSLQDTFAVLEQVVAQRLWQALHPDARRGNSEPRLACPAPAGQEPHGCFVREHELDEDAQLLLLLAPAAISLKGHALWRILSSTLPGYRVRYEPPDGGSVEEPSGE